MCARWDVIAWLAPCRHPAVEQFSNGITIYLNSLPVANAPPIEHSVFQLTKEALFLYCLPNNPFVSAGKGLSSNHAVQEETYTCT